MFRMAPPVNSDARPMSAVEGQETRDFLRRIPILAGFPDKSLDEIAAVMRGPRHVAAGEILFEEGDAAGDIFFIVDGEFEVLKNEAGGAGRHRIATLEEGTSIGEVSLLDTQPRSASLRATRDSRVCSVAIADLASPLDDSPSVANRLKIRLAYQMATRLRRSDEMTVRTLRDKLSEAERRYEMSKFISRTLIGLALYMFSLGLASALAREVPDTTAISLPILAAFAFGVYRTVKTSPWPPSAYGFTLRNWRGNALEAVLLSIPAAFVIVAAKWVAIQVMPSFAGQPLFDLARSTGLSLREVLLYGLAYAAFTPIQEIVARAGIQSSLQMFLDHRYRVVEAIVLSNLLFSATHLHVSLTLALLVFPMGLFWGWIFARQGSLVGSSVSHILLGVFGLFVVGFPVL